MVNRYLKLSAEESAIIKNQFDISKNKLNNIIRIIRNYRISRKKELALKNKLKLNISTLKAKISNLEITFPEDERKIYYHSHHLREEPIKAKDINEINKDNQNNKDESDPIQDLSEIKSKLSRFEE